MPRDTMRYWLAVTAREAREKADRKQVHVAAAMDRDQSTVNRFEQGITWPRNADLVIAAYAEDLDLSPYELWAEALQRWEEAGEVATVAELQALKENDATEPGEAGAPPAPQGALGRRLRDQRTKRANPQPSQRRKAEGGQKDAGG